MKGTAQELQEATADGNETGKGGEVNGCEAMEG
jgi:hypothetical protein